MEYSFKEKTYRTLPGGDRRSTPGADAWCHGMRTVSSEGLNRWALTAETNDDGDRLMSRHSTVEPCSPSTISYTPRGFPPTSALDVALGVNAFLPATTKAGYTRVRMKWGKEVNIFIIRTYFYITKLETDMTTY
ncbi:hypothetical protein ACJJTC_003609 [Scirpophaga incertulas]